ncbi:cysteine desulfurase [Ignatzschineria indica]|uniref:cysteine desulfurase family protein n=1 Tax=Ignatzschineria indica TaxID=472583 RepID=UPI002575EE50|nr:cysteine desulfurase family protein [Ignatzschineria indica]MDM1544393.1 cysteine desulfurase [Ignatzschineria indica]
MKSILESFGIDPFMKQRDDQQNHALQKGSIGKSDSKLPTKPQFSGIIYLDYAATTPVDPEVIDSMVSAMECDWANVGSPHELGMLAKQRIEDALSEIAAHFNLQRDEIIITSGATESINHALKGVLMAQKKREIITTTIEHKATVNTVQALMKQGYRAKFIAPNAERVITTEMIESAITEETALISLIWVNNETGDKLPVEEIAQIARRYKIPIHIDATQAAPHFQFDATQFDLVSLSAHKCYGPKGIGLLYRRAFPKLPMKPLIDGSGGQMALRAGTMMNESIIGFAKALNLIAQRWEDERHRLVRLESLLLKQLLPYGVEVNSASPLAEREPGVLNLYIPHVHADALMALTPKVAVAKGSACNSDSSLPSYVLTEMGYSDRRALSSIRVSVGHFTTEEEILTAGNYLSEAIAFLQSIALGEPTAWYGEYNLYDSDISSILMPSFVVGSHEGYRESEIAAEPLLVIDEPHYQLALYGSVDLLEVDDGKILKLQDITAKVYGAPFYLALFNELIKTLRESSLTPNLSLETLLERRIPAQYLRDSLQIEKALRSFVNESL